MLKTIPVDVFDAAESGDVESLKKYLMLGGNPHATIERAWAQSISYVGWDSGHPEVICCIVDYLKQSGKNLNGIATHDVLETSCIVGDIRIVEYLHEQGVDIRPKRDWFLKAALENKRNMIVNYINSVRPFVTNEISLNSFF